MSKLVQKTLLSRRDEIANGTNVLELHMDPRLEQRCLTGIKWADAVFGANECEQGITPSSSILFSGTSGAGKTTFSLQLADSWTSQGNVCLYNTCEESALQVRKATKRLNLKNGFIISEDRKVVDVLKHADWLRKENPNKNLLIICDSLQRHDDGFYADGTINSASTVRVTEMFTNYCKATYASTLLISQVTKNGVFSGKNAIKHDTDVHCHIYIEKSPKSPWFGQRVFQLDKNRFGRSGHGYVLGMDGAKGLIEQEYFENSLND